MTRVLSLLTMLVASASSAAPTIHMSVPETIVAAPDLRVEAERGLMLVPENRLDPTSRLIAVHFIRFPALQGTAGRAPVFLLPGGPGTDWSFKKDAPQLHERLQSVQRLRRTRDVIYVSQRGNPAAPGVVADLRQQTPAYPLNEPLTSTLIRERQRATLQTSLQHWSNRGVDLRGYDILNIVDDVHDLRAALGYDKIVLRGCSFGSQWSLVYLKRWPRTVDRALLSGVEPLDHTYDSPRALWASLERLAHRAASDPALAGQIPRGGLLSVVQATIERLERQPERVVIEDPATGAVIALTVGADDVRRLVADRASFGKTPEEALGNWPRWVLEMQRGDLRFVAAKSWELRRGDRPGAPLIGVLIDNSLGITAKRDAQLLAETETRWLGDINAGYRDTLDLTPTPRVNDDFRGDGRIDAPVLLMAGDLDWSTPIENARGLRSSLSHGHLIEVEGGTHCDETQVMATRRPEALERVYSFIDADFERTTPETFFATLPKKVVYPAIRFASPAGPSLYEQWLTPQQFTLADTSRVTHLTAAVQSAVSSPRGDYVAWIDAGELYLAREPEFEPEVLVRRAGGEAVVKIHASSDGRTILFRRGSYRAALGAIAGWDTRELWQVDVESKSVQRVATGAEVPAALTFAPGGEAFAYAEGNILHEFRRDQAGQWVRRQLSQPDPRHDAAIGIGDIAYSPDGMQVAFVSERKAKQSYVAIHDIAKQTTHYVDPGIYRDALPAWAPDGAELVFVRAPGNWSKFYRFTPQGTRAPWSILAVDVKTGAVRTVWKADAGRGSVPSTFAPIWTADDRILFTSEKTGWNLLYAVPAQGGPAVLLTPGKGEVEHPVLSADGRTLLFDTNIGDLGRRHVWSLGIGEGTARPLTAGSGVERAPHITRGGHILYRVDYREGSAFPQLRVHGSNDSARAISLQSAEAGRLNQQLWKQFQPEQVLSIRADDGVTSYHKVIEPRTPAPPDGYPVVVNAHGGPTSQTTPGAGPRFAFGQYLASRGYLFVDINYRGSSGFGIDYRFPSGRGATGGSEVKDLAALARYLKRRGDVNSRRIAIMGGSYGGYLVALAMSRLPKDYAVGVSLYGVADWIIEMKKDQLSASDSAPPDFIRLAERARIEDLAYESSPAPLLDHWRGPTLLTVGELDTKGHMESVIDLGYELLSRQVPVEIHVDPAGGHDVFPAARVFDFFEKHLK